MVPPQCFRRWRLHGALVVVFALSWPFYGAYVALLWCLRQFAARRNVYVPPQVVRPPVCRRQGVRFFVRFLTDVCAWRGFHHGAPTV